MALVVVGFVGSIARPASACEPSPEPDILESVSSHGVAGVVERRVIAANPAPWGRSVWAVTRVWGEVVVDRWEVSDRRWDHCPSSPYGTVDGFRYDLPPEYVGWAAAQPGGTVDGLTAAALEGRFGPARTMAGGGFDTAMAWMRVMPSLLALPLLVAVTVVWVVSRRRRREDAYLF